jgi:putative addiction module CopG family antidote
MDTSLTPALRRFVDRQIKSGRFKNAGEVINAALQQMAVAASQAGSLAGLAALSGLGDSPDIDGLVVIVMMEAAKDAEQDLKDIMADVKAATAAKAKLRDLINRVNRDVAANARGCTADDNRKLDFSRGLGGEPAYHRAPMPVLDPDAEGGVRLTPCDLHRGKITSYDQLVVIRDDLRGQLDSLSEMSEMTSLRLQMAMDRRSKFIETLSNIMKKISTTADTLVQNLK